ncbi:16S rRNA (cytosine(967)-C(5))-methyltransferase RsmB [Virgibacillus sp. W0430]|uniref:16S rRNA (cytosine(967)-C(5))-methyltransferase RsmB n=1 Tax=Virgibacillus sp. W0430 TaxID=3391580 RepID=UPI003F461ABC
MAKYAKYNLRNSILDLLLRMEEGGGYSHLLISNEIKRKNILVKDEGLFTEIVYGTMERKLTLDFYLQSFIKKSSKIEAWVRMLLRMSVYQIVYLDKVPDYAVINEAVEIAKQRGHKGIASLVNGVLRNIIRNGVPNTDEIKNERERLAIETSHPEWLVNRWVQNYGFATTKQMCEANLNHNPISVRVQQLKLTRNEAMDQLRKEGYEIKPSLLAKHGIIIERGNIMKSQLFLDGCLTIQDQASMLVAEMLNVSPNMVVLDACSAPGGKATHIAEMMENKGEIHAYDLHKNKIKLIKDKADDLDLTIIHAKQQDARELATVHDASSFDRIIVDAPCSGLGVIQGKPDVKYNKSEQDIVRLASIQLEILESVAPLLKKDGLLMYSTCTVDPTENESVVQAFIQRNTDFHVDASFFEQLPKPVQHSEGRSAYGLQLFPQTFQTDGFFLTRLKHV